jgi:predicted CXXCH cytochrome family protein
MTTGSHHMQLYWVPSPWVDESPATEGRGVYVERCATCHGEAGEGVPPADLPERDGVDVAWGPALAGAGRTPAQVARWLSDFEHGRLHASLTPQERIRVEHYVVRLQVRGRLQQFPFAWWVAGQRWIHEEDTFLQPPEPHPEREGYEQTWSDACDQCHSVAPVADWSPAEPSMRASVAELGIACEACHGPAQAHAEAYRDPVGRYLGRLGEGPAAHVVNPADLDHRAATAVCAQCHGEVVREVPGGPPFPVGEALEPWGHLVQRRDPPHPAWLAEALQAEPDLLDTAFWRDGTMRVAGRDANALAVSACYERGTLSCITCHDPHGDDPNDQLRPGARGDAVCAECHADVAAAGSDHTHHPVESEGSRCMNCHMPHTTLGLLGAMRSHRIDSPSAVRERETGRPGACTLCHTDRTLTWTAEALERWYGHEVPAVGGDDRAAAVDGLLRGDAAQRAVWAWHLGWAPAQRASGTDWQPGILAQVLDDPYSAVRYIAGESLRVSPGFERVVYDFTAEPAARRAVRDQVLQQWRTSDPAPRPALLIREGGLDEDLVRLLVLMRDDRPVVVSE